jgi:Domain of unknown function (DUF4062)
MDKRFQVFVSSTFKDLQDERQEVIQALLELDCIPSGMELFPAADEDQWSLIKRVIDDCDYYIVIVAGRYGSIGPEDKSYTQMEYEYALLKGKPIISFLHQSPDTLPANKTELAPEGRAKLAEFRELVQKKVCKYWQTPAELGSVVSRSIISLIKQKPGIGWVRANLVPSEITSTEMLRLKNRIEELEKDLAEAKSTSNTAYMNLSQGKDKTKIEFRYIYYSDAGVLQKEWANCVIELSWDEVFASISTLLELEPSKATIQKRLGEIIYAITENIITEEVLELELSKHTIQERLEEVGKFKVEAIISEFLPPTKTKGYSCFIEEKTIDKIMLQFRALGYVESPIVKESFAFGRLISNTYYWKSTPLGDRKMLNDRAIKRSS